MQPYDLPALNQAFGRGGDVRFVAGPGGLPVAEIANTHATATVALQGGQVLAYQPRNQAPVLWLSAFSRFEENRAIRGGIPVCWPWFGPHPDDPALPAHGFVRTILWSVKFAEALPDGATRLVLEKTDDESTRALWPHRFHLELTVVVGAGLQVELLVRNPGPDAFTMTGALHTYFTVSDISAVTIRGLERCPYIDKVDEGRRKTQEGPITVSGETDRVYVPTSEACVIDDPGLERSIQVAKAGSRSTVVWNPWTEKAARLPDFGDEEYRGMLCVETANAGEDAVRVPPAGLHRLQVVIRAV